MNLQFTKREPTGKSTKTIELEICPTYKEWEIQLCKLINEPVTSLCIEWNVPDPGTTFQLIDLIQNFIQYRDTLIPKGGICIYATYKGAIDALEQRGIAEIS